MCLPPIYSHCHRSSRYFIDVPVLIGLYSQLSVLHAARMIYIAFASQHDRVVIWTRIKQRQKIRVKILCQMNLNALCPSLKSTSHSWARHCNLFFLNTFDTLLTFCFTIVLILFRRCQSIVGWLIIIVDTLLGHPGVWLLLVHYGSFIDHTNTPILIAISLFESNFVCCAHDFHCLCITRRSKINYDCTGLSSSTNTDIWCQIDPLVILIDLQMRGIVWLMNDP